MRLLSIDWDYFYSDSLPYDMGHNEAYSGILANLLWTTRCNSVNLFTHESLMDAYVPSVPRGFWGKVLKNKPVIYMAESHKEIWDLLESEIQVVSLDAHHDCGYCPIDKKSLCVDCSNWGAVGRMLGRIGSMDLYYPTWRKDTPEGFLHGRKVYKPSSISYGLPSPAEYDKVFVCRSGAWTPPWHDAAFDRFVRQSGCTIVGKVPQRGVSIKEARECAKNLNASFKQLRMGLSA
jgi:hypothetical protein